MNDESDPRPQWLQQPNVTQMRIEDQPGSAKSMPQQGEMDSETKRIYDFAIRTPYPNHVIVDDGKGLLSLGFSVDDVMLVLEAFYTSECYIFWNPSHKLGDIFQA